MRLKGPNVSSRYSMSVCMRKIFRVLQVETSRPHVTHSPSVKIFSAYYITCDIQRLRCSELCEPGTVQLIATCRCGPQHHISCAGMLLIFHWTACIVPSCKASCSEAQDLHHIEHSILHPCYQCNGTGRLMCLSGGCFPATEIQGSCWQVRSSHEARVCLALSIQSGTLTPCNTLQYLFLCTPCRPAPVHTLHPVVSACCCHLPPEGLLQHAICPGAARL